jgi:ketosteroid isomerase-like protein
MCNQSEMVLERVPRASYSSSMQHTVTTRDTIEAYFSSIGPKPDWQEYFAADVVFTNFVSPAKRVNGREAFLEATSGFYRMIVALDVRHLVVEDDHACALTRYELQPPAGPAFISDVAELFVVRDGQIVSLEIYFDPTPYPRR